MEEYNVNNKTLYMNERGQGLEVFLYRRTQIQQRLICIRSTPINKFVNVIWSKNLSANCIQFAHMVKEALDTVLLTV